jgi:hypothetical protein
VMTSTLMVNGLTYFGIKPLVPADRTRGSPRPRWRRPA